VPGGRWRSSGAPWRPAFRSHEALLGGKGSRSGCVRQLCPAPPKRPHPLRPGDCPARLPRPAASSLATLSPLLPRSGWQALSILASLPLAEGFFPSPVLSLTPMHQGRWKHPPDLNKDKRRAVRPAGGERASFYTGWTCKAAPQVVWSRARRVPKISQDFGIYSEQVLVRMKAVVRAVSFRSDATPDPKACPVGTATEGFRVDG